jgi:bifunctional non-homologous end joining protein LigD
MLATSAAELPRGKQWTYEVKWDGYRTLALKEGRRVKLLSRNLKDATAQYPSVVRAVAQVRADAALLDGEIVALDEHGHPSFQALHHQSSGAIVFYAFDLLHLNGHDLTRMPLEERRAALAPVVEGTRILRSDPLAKHANLRERGPQLMRHTRYEFRPEPHQLALASELD